MPMIITLKDLRERGACPFNVRRFKRHFGTKVAVTKARCIELADLFHWESAAEFLFRREDQADYSADVRLIYDAFWERWHALNADLQAGKITATERRLRARKNDRRLLTDLALAFWKMSRKYRRPLELKP